MGKVLVIVDVQKEFDKFIQHDLVDELYEYAKNFKRVYQIWDTHKTDVAPTYTFPNQVEAVKKKYGKSHFSDEVTKFIKEVEDETFEGNTFKLSDNKGYIVRVDNNHEWFYVNPEIVELIQKIQNDKVILVGGADNECLEDVYQAFRAFGLNTHINKKYVYSAKTNNSDSVNEGVYDVKNDYIDKIINIEKALNISEAIDLSNNYPYKWLKFKVRNEKELDTIVTLFYNNYKIENNTPLSTILKELHQVMNNEEHYLAIKLNDNFFDIIDTNLDDKYYSINPKLYTIRDLYDFGYAPTYNPRKIERTLESTKLFSPRKIERFK